MCLFLRLTVDLVSWFECEDPLWVIGVRFGLRFGCFDVVTVSEEESIRWGSWVSGYSGGSWVSGFSGGLWFNWNCVSPIFFGVESGAMVSSGKDKRSGAHRFTGKRWCLQFVGGKALGRGFTNSGTGGDVAGKRAGEGDGERYKFQSIVIFGVLGGSHMVVCGVEFSVLKELSGGVVAGEIISGFGGPKGVVWRWLEQSQSWIWALRLMVSQGFALWSNLINRWGRFELRVVRETNGLDYRRISTQARGCDESKSDNGTLTATWLADSYGEEVGGP
ncbi:unnamed protein product [Arabidopsis arenosa]|uniref:Uncharacterized protein n=1 Tax=Arabidopsis arenosa TaxID=38785 RepID=A0A8S2AZP1_ARAAE|nr:unnamed protein product [Arabidopsis arenosa]